jgi:hypothetical protein
LITAIRCGRWSPIFAKREGHIVHMRFHQNLTQAQIARELDRCASAGSGR